MTAPKPLPVVELYVPTAYVAPVGIAEDKVEVVLVELVELVVVALLVPSSAAVARATMLEPLLPGRFVTP
jgi:hypothetical protein